MSDLTELGKAFKKKFPQYQDLSDKEAGRAAKLAYPGVYDDIEDDEMDDNYQSRNTSLAPTRSRAGSYELEFEGFERWMQAEAGVNQLALNPGLMKQYEEVFNFYNPRGGWITRWFDEKRDPRRIQNALQL